MSRNQNVFTQIHFKILLPPQNKKIIKVFKTYQSHNPSHFNIHPKINIIFLTNLLLQAHFILSKSHLEF